MKIKMNVTIEKDLHEAFKKWCAQNQTDCSKMIAYMIQKKLMEKKKNAA
jgi:hypothetical protein